MPPERPPLPLRWAFQPVSDRRDGSIRWQWRAYQHNGDLAFESGGTFETYTECLADAASKGYVAR